MPAAGASDATIAREPIWRLSFFIPLPFLLPLPQNSTFTIWESDPFEGWDGTRVNVVDGILGRPDASVSPATSMWFRHVVRPLEDPVSLAMEAFDEVLSSFIPTEGVKRRLEDPGDEPPLETGRTVVQLTRICAGPPSQEALEQGWDLSDRRDDDRDEPVHETDIKLSSWLTREFDKAIAHLNLHLVALATVSHDVSFGPVSNRALPPFVLQLLSQVTDNEHAPEASLFALHQFPGPILGDIISEGSFEHAGRIAAREYSQGHPYFPVAEALVEARRALREGRHTHAVLEAGLVAELLITTTLREAGTALGFTQHAIDVMVRAPFIQRARDHLPSLLGLDRDLADRGTSLGHWKQCAYDLRNAVVHAGLRPDGPAAEHALVVTEALLTDVARALRIRPETTELADLLLSTE